MTYQAIYRQWRPQLFADLVGQEHVTRTLQNALTLDRLAHAYLFCGPRGTGKTSAAKILAKTINCENGSGREPCNQCASCLGITAGRVMDVQEIDAASNRGIDEIRDLRDKTRYAPVEVRHKVYIIDEVHMLTSEAFNALLKTLEEPPERVLFILATTEPHKLPATIISRCQRLDFHLIGVSDIVERLSKIVTAAERVCDEQAMYLIAEEAAGGLRDALSLLEQVMAYSQNDKISQEDVLAVLGAVGRDVFYDFTEFLSHRDLAGALLLLQDVAAGGKDLHHFTQQAVSYYRDLMVAGVCGDDAVRLGIAPEWAKRLKSQSDRLGMGTIGMVLAELHALLAEIRWSTRPRLLWELAIIRMLGFGAVSSETQAEKAAAAPKRAEPQQVSQAQNISEPPSGYKKSASAGPSAPAGQASLQNLERMWPRIMDLVKKESVKTHALLLSGEAVCCEGNTLEIRFGGAFLCEMMESNENKKPLQDVLQKVFGTVPAIRCRVSTDSAKPVTGEKDPEELISSAVEIFHGKVVDDTGRS
ncbi:MAG: DNA polymerase III subunit gamma/tau [Bacillota bacterium]|nr:DNA polymerase III subunit gamma/tau [Bacillota bacterium]MDW7684728.1 DNA polymerase III subunit gamma/tau [Bacillota bacterium]